MGYVFGPVPSRRLGRSLGLDLIPFKTCTYDCVYCQLGRTTHKTVERRAWVPMQPVSEQPAAYTRRVTAGNNGIVGARRPAGSDGPRWV